MAELPSHLGSDPAPTHTRWAAGCVCVGAGGQPASWGDGQVVTALLCRMGAVLAGALGKTVAVGS